MVLIPDPEVYTTSRVQDGGQLPGKPTWGPYLNVPKAIEHERELTLLDPLGALAWDRRADARRAAFLASSSAAALERIVRCTQEHS